MRVILALVLAIPFSNFFSIDGYTPPAVQALLIRYWQEHGRPLSVLRASFTVLVVCGTNTAERCTLNAER